MFDTTRANTNIKAAHSPSQQQQFATPPPAQQYQNSLYSEQNSMYPQPQHQAYQPFQHPQQTQYQYQQQQQQQQHQQQQYTPPQQGYISPLAQSPSNDFKTSTPPTITASTVTSPGYDYHNRIDVIRRLCSLQHPDGHWDYSTELADMVKMWGGRDLMAPAHGATALTQACLADLCNYVWTAQRDGREHESLSAAELISLQSVNWDLGWAKNAMDRATAWMNGYR
jgi:hypothetical protein